MRNRIAAALILGVMMAGVVSPTAGVATSNFETRSKSQCDKAFRAIDMFSPQGNGKKKEPFSVGAYYMLASVGGSENPKYKKGALEAIRLAKKVTGPQNDALLDALARSLRSTDGIQVSRYEELYEKLIDNIDQGTC